MLRPAGGDVYALAVDKIHDHEELVVKPAAPAVMATGLYAGTTLADDGSPILLFDPAGLAEVGGVRLEMQERTARVAEGPAAVAAQATAVLLFRGLDGGRRALRLAVVDRIEEVPASAIRQGAGQLRVQLGEAILPLAGVNGDLPEDKVRLFRLNDGSSEIGYAFREVVDLSAIDNEVILAEVPGEVSGVSLIGGEPAELVDAHWLFSTHLGAAARRSPDQPLVPPAGRRCRGCSTCFARSSKPPATASSATTRMSSPTWSSPPTARRGGDRGRAPDRASRRPRFRRRGGRQHLPLRPRGPADGAEGRREGEMNELLLIVTIAGQRVALPASAVESVVELDTLIPVPRAAPHVAGLSALRSRVLTVIDCMRSLELGVTECEDSIREAAVVELDGHHYALLVDLVEDVVEAMSDPAPVRAAMGPGWERVSRGMVETEQGPLLLVEVAALVAGSRSARGLSSSLHLDRTCHPILAGNLEKP